MISAFASRSAARRPWCVGCAFQDVIKHELFGLSPLDSVIYAIAIGVVTAMTLASWLSAHRAAKVDSIAAVRAD